LSQEILADELAREFTAPAMPVEIKLHHYPKTKEVAMAGKYELFKTSSHFDSTAKHPDWLGGDTTGVQELALPSA
jgi:hypothetical protein